MRQVRKRRAIAGGWIMTGAALLLPVGLHAQDAPQPASLTAPVGAPVTAELLERALRTSQSAELLSFYAAHGYKPLWVQPDGTLSPAAGDLLALTASAELDGIDPATLAYSPLLAAARGGSVAPSAELEVALSAAFAAYAQALLSAPDREMSYEHANLQPQAPAVQTLLQRAAGAPSLGEYLHAMQWMHPLYAPLRQAAAAAPDGSAERAAIMRNLGRIRGIPRDAGARYVLVDANSARLYMYEGDRVVDSMKVVVGKPERDTQTPVMAGYIRYATVNPYWNLPPDQVRKNIAPKARSMGLGYLKRGGYQVVSEWDAAAEVLDPAKIDWHAVETGKQAITMRQLPGSTNAMGNVKFEFPNPQGIYLHDTPSKDLMDKASRHFSSGCIRLEDAQRLGRWLMGAELPKLEGPEQRVDLAEPIPIYVTYLTAQLEGEQVVLGPDPYGRNGADSTALALKSE